MNILASRYQDCTASAYAIFKLVQVELRLLIFSKLVDISNRRWVRLPDHSMRAMSKFNGKYSFLSHSYSSVRWAFSSCYSMNHRRQLKTPHMSRKLIMKKTLPHPHLFSQEILSSVCVFLEQQNNLMNYSFLLFILFFRRIICLFFHMKMKKNTTSFLLLQTLSFSFYEDVVAVFLPARFPAVVFVVVAGFVVVAVVKVDR